MAKRTLFLTGATGTVGSGILEVLSETGEFNVTCLIRDQQKGAQVEALGAKVVIGDMSDEVLFERLRGRGSYDFIIHAAQAHYERYSANEIHELEARAVRNLESLRDGVTQLMIFTGGVWSCGTGSHGQPITETTPPRPFKGSEARVELWRELENRRDFPWAQLCLPSMVYGSVGPLISIANTFRSGATIDVLDEEVKWSVIERLDLGQAYLALLRYGKAGDRYLVAEDDPVSVVTFYETIGAMVGSGTVVLKPLVELSASMTADVLERKRTSQPVDSSRFKRATGWRAEEKFATSVKTLLAWNGGLSGRL
ncbi:MAG: NAD-dependent epimerase/dehydratase family protein [Lacunisphaera sp.]